MEVSVTTGQLKGRNGSTDLWSMILQLRSFIGTLLVLAFKCVLFSLAVFVFMLTIDTL